MGKLNTFLRLAARNGVMRLALLGSGPFEPFLFAAIGASATPSSEGEVFAVDSSRDVTTILDQLVNGSPIPKMI